jgi:hypothetical protein
MAGWSLSERAIWRRRAARLAALLPWMLGFLAALGFDRPPAWFPQHARIPTAGILWLFLLGLSPVQDVLRFGQADIATMWLMAGGTLLATRAREGRLGRRSEWGAGICLATATLFKIYPGVLLLYYLYKRRYRLVFAAACPAVVWLALCAVLLGGGALRDFVTVLAQGGGPSFTATPWSFGSLALLDRILTINPYGTPLVSLSHSTILVLYLIWVALVLVACARAIPRQVRPHSLALELAVCCAAMLLIFPKLEVIHLAVLGLLGPGLWRWIAGSSGRIHAGGIWQDRLLAGLFIGCLYLSNLLHAYLAQQAVVRYDVVLALVLMAAGFLLPTVQADFRSRCQALALIVALGFMLNTAAFLNVAAWWSLPITGIDAVLGGLQFYLLLLFAGYCWLLLTSERTRRARTFAVLTAEVEYTEQRDDRHQRAQWKERSHDIQTRSAVAYWRQRGARHWPGRGGALAHPQSPQAGEGPGGGRAGTA